MQKQHHPNNPPPEILGQGTVEENTDERVVRYVDRRSGVTIYQLGEVQFKPAGPIRREPDYVSTWRGTYKALLKYIDLLNAVADDIEETGGANLPIKMSEYDNRFRTE